MDKVASVITLVISRDEPCLGLFELDYQSPDYRGFHRYQICLVMRDDKVAEAWQDLGLSKNIGTVPVRIPGGAVDEITGKFHIEHTVGELMEMADQRRSRPSFDKRELAQINL